MEQTYRGNFFSKSINVQTKIRPCRGEFFLKINKRACTSIRYTRVLVYFLTFVLFCKFNQKKCRLFGSLEQAIYQCTKRNISSWSLSPRCQTSMGYTVTQPFYHCRQPFFNLPIKFLHQDWFLERGHLQTTSSWQGLEGV